jgi:hypothetical protein
MPTPFSEIIGNGQRPKYTLIDDVTESASGYSNYNLDNTFYTIFFNSNKDSTNIENKDFFKKENEEYNLETGIYTFSINSNILRKSSMINQIMTLFITFFFKSEKRETNKNQDKAINNSIFL